MCARYRVSQSGASIEGGNLTIKLEHFWGSYFMCFCLGKQLNIFALICVSKFFSPFVTRSLNDETWKVYKIFPLIFNSISEKVCFCCHRSLGCSKKSWNLISLFWFSWTNRWLLKIPQKNVSVELFSWKSISKALKWWKTARNFYKTLKSFLKLSCQHFIKNFKRFEKFWPFWTLKNPCKRSIFQQKSSSITKSSFLTLKKI